jgi:hypothetical protein
MSTNATMSDEMSLKDKLASDEMSLDDKLAAIDAAMAVAQAQASDDAASRGSSFVVAPLDPADLTMCQGCQ